MHLMVNQMLYSREGLARIPELVAESAHGNPAPALAVASGLAPRGPERNGAQWATGCDGSRSWLVEGVPPESHPALGDYWRVETPVLCEALGVKGPPPESQRFLFPGASRCPVRCSDNDRGER